MRCSNDGGLESAEMVLNGGTLLDLVQGMGGECLGKRKWK